MHGGTLCSAHSRANVGAGAPSGNQNRREHGFYARTFTIQEAADLAAHAEDDNLTDEIALARVILRRLFVRMQTVESYEMPQDTPPETVAELTYQLNTLAKLMNASIRTVARLLRDQKALGGSGSIEDAINEALDRLADDFEMLL